MRDRQSFYRQSENKLNAQKCVVDGIEFDSRREAKRYAELKLLERLGEINTLQLQVKFPLIPAQYEESTAVFTKGAHKGEPKRGRLIERAVDYVADFTYFTKDGEYVVEDAKGFRDPSSAIYASFVHKRKMMLFFHGIIVKEV